MKRSQVAVVLATQKEWSTWLSLRQKLWPKHSLAIHEKEVDEVFAKQDEDCLLAFIGDEVVGFVECSVRPYAEGCKTDGVGYIEGWFVLPDYRGKGIGKELVLAAEAWAKRKDCKEMASDCEIDNDGSCAAHTALGYEQKSKLVHFVKDL